MRQVRHCLLALLLTFTTTGATAANAKDFQHNPIVLVPGNGGSQLWARLNRTQSPWYCKSSSHGDSAELLWLQMSNLLYPAVKCLAYNLKLRKSDSTLFSFFDRGWGATRDNFGVNSFVPGFGTVDTMLWITDWKSKYTAYYSTLVAYLESELGFSRNTTIRGAPYDFRKAPNELQTYFDQLKELIEDSYAASGGKQVVLVAHSMGGKLALHFLHMQSQQWKDKYLKHFVAAGAAFGGVPVSLLALLSGYSLGIPIIKPIWFRPVQRSWPSTHYMLPDPAVYPDDVPLVTGPSGTVYTLANLSSLYAEIGYSEGQYEYNQYARLTDVTKPPGVATTCVFGEELPTPVELKWNKANGFPEDQPSSIQHDSGDGTVPALTARVCKAWSTGKDKVRVRVTGLKGAQHVAMLSDDRFVRLVASIATSSNTD